MTRPLLPRPSFKQRALQRLEFKAVKEAIRASKRPAHNSEMRLYRARLRLYAARAGDISYLTAGQFEALPEHEKSEVMALGLPVRDIVGERAIAGLRVRARKNAAKERGVANRLASAARKVAKAKPKPKAPIDWNDRMMRRRLPRAKMAVEPLW